jgi:hypothetical protein
MAATAAGIRAVAAGAAVTKPYIRFLFGRWWCFNSREEAHLTHTKAWHGETPERAYISWANFNTMKP